MLSYYVITPASGIIPHKTCFANVCKWSVISHDSSCNLQYNVAVYLHYFLLYLVFLALCTEIKGTIMPCMLSFTLYMDWYGLLLM